MSVPEQVPYKEYRATGSNNSFEITFYLPDPKDLVVMVNKEIPLVGAYSIVGDSVVFSTPPNEGDLVELTRDTQLDRETNFKSYDNSFRPETINFDLDKIWLVLQESNLVDAKILARLKQEIEWRRTHDFNYDELAQVREKQLFDALKGYTDTLNAATNPGVFQGVVAGVVFARDGKSIQTHLEEILESLAQERENIDLKADQTYVEEQLDLKANQDTTYSKTEVDSALDKKASKVDIYTKPEVDTALSAVAAGHKAYTTLALAQAAQETLPANTIVEVTNDPTAPNNGTYQWNGTTLTKSAYDPLTQAKADASTKANTAETNAKDYFSNNGDAKLIAIVNSNINYTISDRLLNFANTVYVITPTGRYVLATPASVSLPSNTKYRLEYNIASNSVRAVGYNAAKAENWLVLGIVTVDANGISTSDFDYTVNGRVSSSGQLGQVFTSSNLTINIDTEGLLFVTRANGRVTSGDRTYTLPEASVALPTTNGVYRVEYNPSTSLVEINTSSSALTRGNIIFARLVRASDVYTLYGVDIYTVNGVVATSGSNPYITGTLLTSDRGDINFDFVARTMTVVASKVRLLTGGKTTILGAHTVDLTTATGATWKYLVFNTATNVFSIKDVTTILAKDEICVAWLKLNERIVDGIPFYTEQGKAVSSVKSNLKTADFLVPFGNVESDYAQPELPSYDAMWSANNGDYNKFYALYDALLAAHPDYITKTTLGNDALGNPLHQYQFSTPEVPTISKKAKIIIFTGIHGGEKAGMYNVYFALKEIAERWQSDKHLEALYWGVNFIVLPVVNPTGYNQNSRYNHNGVDLARNFTAGWSAALENGGTAPLDQAESVIMDAVLSNNTDAIYMCSHHNFGDNTDRFIWNAGSTYFTRSLAKNLIIGQTIKAKARYNWMPQANNYYIGYADLGQPSGSEGLQAVDKYGINASSFEISSSFAWEAGMPKLSGAVATIGVETFINWLLMNVKYAPQLYNTQINL